MISKKKKLIISLMLILMFVLFNLQISFAENNEDDIKKEIIKSKKTSIKRSIASSDDDIENANPNEIEEVVADDGKNDVAIVKMKNSTKDANANKTSRDKNVIKYKNYEKFNFDELDVAGEGASEGGISIVPREERKYKNKLPEKNNFNYEIKKTINTVN
ncbi:MAG: hypothetical protein HQK51_03165 [Oligoflexia bacterium]|nr:hypothetical protein [Oligoflexia bacterium]